MHDTEYGIGTCAGGRGCPTVQAIVAIEAEARAAALADAVATAEAELQEHGDPDRMLAAIKGEASR